MSTPPDDSLQQLAAMVSEARDVLVITGAGLSADSGLPTYRGIGGLYEGTPTGEGIAIEDALSGTMLAARPELCWKYIHQIESACRGAQPNVGHRVLAAMESSERRVCVLTQNVDGFHRAAGSERVIEIHGNIHDLACVRCDYRQRVDDYAALAPVPRCPQCGQVVRPQVVLFGESLPSPATAMLGAELREGFDLVLTIGTTSAFPYIAAPVVLAAEQGVATVEINPGPTEVSGFVGLKIAHRARVVLEDLARRLGLDP